MTNRKYEFVFGDELPVGSGRTVKRIRALADIESLGVRRGDLGGYIESQVNLQTTGDTQICGTARMYSNTLICLGETK